MIRNLLPWTAGCLLAAFAVSSCESDDVDYGPISAAIEIGVEEVTPSSAKIRLTTEQENVASTRSSSRRRSPNSSMRPTTPSTVWPSSRSAAKRPGLPFEQTLAGLMPKVEYSFAVVGLDSSGQRITAPTFARFTTAYASSLVEARFETNPDDLHLHGQDHAERLHGLLPLHFRQRPQRSHRGRAQGRCSKPAAAA